MLFNYRLRFLREKNNYKQKDISKMLGISNSRYNHYESEVDIIPIQYLIKLCEFYNVSLDYVFCFTNDPTYANLKSKVDNKLSASRLKQLRLDNNLTLQELGKILGCSHSLIHSYEKGTYIIATKHLYNICKTYKISAEYLLGKMDTVIKLKKIKLELL